MTTYDALSEHSEELLKAAFVVTHGPKVSPLYDYVYDLACLLRVNITCRTYSHTRIPAALETSRRREVLTFNHHAKAPHREPHTARRDALTETSTHRSSHCAWLSVAVVGRPEGRGA